MPPSREHPVAGALRVKRGFGALLCYNIWPRVQHEFRRSPQLSLSPHHGMTQLARHL